MKSTPTGIYSIVISATMAAFSPLLAQGVISINLKAGATNNQNTFAGFTAWTPGAWINTAAGNVTDLADADGTTTTADISAPGTRAGSFSGQALNFSPMKSGIQFFGENAAATVISEIPYQNYKIVVYLTGYDGNNASYISDGTTTYYWDPKAFSKILNQTTQTSYEQGTTAIKANIAIFGTDEVPLTSPSVTFNFGLAPGASGGGGIGGYQIIEVPAPPKGNEINLTVARNGANYDFVWTSSPGKVYDLLSAANLGADPASEWDPHLAPLADYQNLPASGTGITQLTGVPSPDPRRFFVILEKDSSPPLPLVDFDMNPSLPEGWIASAPVNGTEWQVGPPTGENGPPAASSGSNSAGTNIGGNYTDSTDISLTSPPITIPPGSDALLSFRQFIDTDLAEIDPDVGTVRILDAGNGDTPITGLELTPIEGDLQQWSDETLSLPSSAVGGKIIKVEFRFISNADGNVWSGFYVDDVSITLP